MQAVTVIVPAGTAALRVPFFVVVRGTDSIMKTVLYGGCLNLIMHSILDILRKWGYKTFLIPNAANGEVREDDRIVKAAQPCPQ